MTRLLLVAVALDQTQIIGITPKERFNPGDRVYLWAGNRVNRIDASVPRTKPTLHFQNNAADLVGSAANLLLNTARDYQLLSVPIVMESTDSFTG
jgi:hypothetical protein